MSNSNCFSLKGTSTCKMYEQQSVLSDTVFTDVASFDDYINSAQETSRNFTNYIRVDLGCAEYNSAANPVLQMRSTLCGYILQKSTEAGCNPQPPLPLCKSVAQETLSSFEKLAKDVCKSTSFKTPSFIPAYVSSLTIDDPSGKTCSLGIEGKAMGTAPGKAASENAGSGSNIQKLGGLYFIIGMSVGSVVLLIAIVVTAVLCIKRSRKNTQSYVQHQDDNEGEIMDVIYEYVPNLFDEIHLSVGDQVLVKIKFDDGWAYGMNMKTKKEGSFPLACVDQPNRTSRVNYDTRINQRASSLYGFPPQ